MSLSLVRSSALAGEVIAGIAPLNEHWDPFVAIAFKNIVNVVQAFFCIFALIAGQVHDLVIHINRRVIVCTLTIAILSLV